MEKKKKKEEKVAQQAYEEHLANMEKVHQSSARD